MVTKAPNLHVSANGVIGAGEIMNMLGTFKVGDTLEISAKFYDGSEGHSHFILTGVYGGIRRGTGIYFTAGAIKWENGSSETFKNDCVYIETVGIYGIRNFSTMV